MPADSISRAGGQSDRPALRRCAPIDPEEFAGRHWGREPLLVRGEPGDFADLFSLEAADELLSSRGLRTPFIRIAKDGTVLDPSRYTGGAGAGAEIADQVRDDKVAALFADGCTVVLQALHRTWAPISELAGQLAADLGHPVQVNAYLTPASNRGFSAHYDVHDVFVLQIAGSKRWVIHRPVLADPLRSQPWNDRSAEVARAAEGEPYLDVVLNPGDRLYLPRGYLHAARALGGVTAHLTLGMQPISRYAVVEALAALAASEPRLRGSLPLGVDVADPEQVAPQLADTIAALRDWLGTVDPNDVADRLRAQAWPRSRPGAVRPLAQAAAVDALDQDSTLTLRPRLRYVLRADGTDHVLLRLADRYIRFPAYTEPALKALLGGQPVRVGELPGLDADDRIVLAGRLLRESICVPA